MSYLERLEKVKNYLYIEKLDFLQIEDPICIFYLTGLKVSCGQIIISKTEAIIFLDARYYEGALKKAPCKVVLQDEKKLKDFFRGFKEKRLFNLGFDSKTTTFFSHQKHLEFFKILQGEIEVQLVPLASPLKEMRAIKDETEIKTLKKAALLAWKGFLHISSLLREGISEDFLAFEFETFCKAHGAEKLSFDPIIAFGENSAIPHHRSSNRILKEGEIVLMDLGVVLDGYCSDMTRCVFFGKADPMLQKYYEIIQKAQKHALSFCKTGTKVKDVDKAAREVMAKEGVEEYFIHSLGHGVGLEIHEFPRIKQDGDDKEVVILPGMVFTIEPGLYKMGLGGVRFEDTILVTEKGYENFYPQGKGE